MKVAVAGVPGAWSTERMREALERAGTESFVFSLADCLHDLNRGTVTIDGIDLSQVDGIVVKKLASQDDPAGRLRLHMLRQLESGGVRVYNRPDAIDLVSDRYRMTMTLIEAGLPVPETFSFETETGLMEALRALKSGVVKPNYTSKARGMVRVGEGATQGELPDPEQMGGRALVQQFIEAPGRDIGACVLDGRFIGAFYRMAVEGAWVTSTSAGGTYAPCDLDARGVELAEKTAGVFDLDYTIVDLVEVDDDYLLYEASPFGGFRGLWESRKQDVAAEYTQFILRDLAK